MNQNNFEKAKIYFERGINFFNKYAGQKDPKTANVAFCAFRKGLNAL